MRTCETPRRSMISIQSPAFSYRHFGAFRFVLATLVMAQHYLANLAPEPLASLSLPYEFGSVAVLVFFCLSGFVITEAADKLYANRPIAFMANRLLRIVPHFLLATMVAIALYFVFSHLGVLRISRDDTFIPNVAFGVRNMALNLLNLASGRDPESGYNFLNVAWAIRYEMFFYVAVFAGLWVLRLSPASTKRIPLGGIFLGLAVLLCPAFIMAVLGHAPRVWQFEPYFVYGGTLYYAIDRRRRIAQLTSFIAVAAMTWQFLADNHDVVKLGVHGDVTAQFIVLAALLAGMTYLAGRQFDIGKKLDRRLGELTYPLYLYHQNVMIVALSLTTEYSYSVLAITAIISWIFVWAIHNVVDPLLDNMRDRVRGRDLRQLSVSSVTPGATTDMCPRATAPTTLR
jgi:peptidoglycan/LPS O-acetylase OafA/YrhL